MYVNVGSHPGNLEGRPAWLEAYGCMPGVRIEREIMLNTYNKISSDYNYWERWIWGCDFPMFPMSASRLGKPEDAIEWLLFDTHRNTYLANMANIGGTTPYFPANGGLLWAIAMMCAGWDGAPDHHAPGFPDNVQWTVKCEGLNPAL